MYILRVGVGLAFATSTADRAAGLQLDLRASLSRLSRAASCFSRPLLTSSPFWTLLTGGTGAGGLGAGAMGDIPALSL